eukprot:6513947-Alexandrium_andersonii.AAC.1
MHHICPNFRQCFAALPRQGRPRIAFFATTTWLQVAHLDSAGIESSPVAHVSGTIPDQQLWSLRVGLCT